MTLDEARSVANDFFYLGLTPYFPSTYLSEFPNEVDTGYLVAGEYWIEGGDVLMWRHTWGNRQTDDYYTDVSKPYYESSLPVRPVRDDLPLGFSVLRELPQPVATYGLNGLSSHAAGALQIEVMNDGSVRKVIRR